jgi:hypothetical protein
MSRTITNVAGASNSVIAGEYWTAAPDDFLWSRSVSPSTSRGAAGGQSRAVVLGVEFVGLGSELGGQGAGAPAIIRSIVRAKPVQPPCRRKYIALTIRRPRLASGKLLLD